MTNPQQEFEDFIVWFSEREAIPLQTRNDFLAHILEVGTLDQKALDFLDTSMQKMIEKDERVARNLEQKINLFSGALLSEQNKETSLSEQTIKQAETSMKDLAQGFKSDYQAAEKEKADAEETSEKSADQSEIERIKALIK